MNTIPKPKYGRFKDAVWFPQEATTMIVGGAGGIGSWLTLLLTRAGFKPIVYDFDIVEEHNLGGQLYGISHINMPKTTALADVVRVFADEQLDTMQEKYVETSMVDKYMFSGFDNMEARKAMFSAWQREYYGSPDAIYLDGRLTFEQLQIFCVKASDKAAVELYRSKHLFADSAVEDAPCTLKSTSHSAAMIASHMVGFFTNFLSELKDKPSSVPFFWEYFIPLDYIKVQQTAE